MSRTAVDADGKLTSVLMTCQQDGTDCPFSGAVDDGTISLKRIDATHTEFTLDKAGTVAGTGNRAVSKAATLLTVCSEGRAALCAAFDNTLMFDWR